MTQIIEELLESVREPKKQNITQPAHGFWQLSSPASSTDVFLRHVPKHIFRSFQLAIFVIGK